MKRIITVAALLLAAATALVGGRVSSAHGGTGASGAPAAHVSVFASGFNNPRGLTFGPGGNLFVAEGGLGGSHSTVGKCTQASGAAAPYTGSSNNLFRGGRIAKVTPSGHVSTVVKALPSSQTSPALGSLVSGVSSVAFIGHRMYALLAGAGCSHGVAHIPNGVIRVHHDGSWTMIANLSRFQRNHPVKNPDEEDFEPDGTWYSMAAFHGVLFPMDSNHGELDRVTPRGNISRVIDISAKVGHVVPTALLPIGGDARNPAMFIGNLGVFGPPDGTVPNEHVYRLTQAGHLASPRQRARAGGRPRPPQRRAVRARAELDAGRPHAGHRRHRPPPARRRSRDGRLGAHLPDRDRGRPRRRVLRVEPGVRLRRRSGTGASHHPLTACRHARAGRGAGPSILV